MNDEVTWDLSSLYKALKQSERTQQGALNLELLEGTDPSLLIIMHEFGDLPVYVAASGSQIVVESLLWPVSMVADSARFNEQLLRMQKLFPLATFGIDRGANGEWVYIMFGSLSATSSLNNVLTEIESLADNVIKATEAFAAQLQDAA